MTRRTLMKRLLQAGSLLVAAVIGIPALLTGAAPAITRRRLENWRAIGTLEEFPLRSVREARVNPSLEGWPRELGPALVYVWRRTEDEVVVFSRACTDLGCPVTYDPGSAWYFCPCHGGIFDHEGRRRAGPPERPLDRYASRVRNGMVEIDVRSVPPVA
jgi:Rieske Fe-S protein